MGLVCLRFEMDSVKSWTTSAPYPPSAALLPTFGGMADGLGSGRVVPRRYIEAHDTGEEDTA